MKKLMLEYKFIIALFVLILFVIAFFVGKAEVELQEQKEESVPVQEYRTVERPETSASAPLPKKEDITIPTEKDMTVAQEVAAAFVMSFHAVDAENPYQYLEDSKPYMTAEAFEKYDAIPKRGTLETQKLTPTATDLLPVDLSESSQIWRVGVTARTTEDEYLFTEYQIHLIKEGQDWKVDGVSINEQ